MRLQAATLDLDQRVAALQCGHASTHLLDLFTGGQVAPGTRLPPERQLAATLGVGRSAVREALAALEILDSFGQRSVLKFSKVEVNPALPAATFDFKVPTGADVVKQ